MNFERNLKKLLEIELSQYGLGGSADTIIPKVHEKFQLNHLKYLGEDLKMVELSIIIQKNKQFLIRVTIHFNLLTITEHFPMQLEIAPMKKHLRMDYEPGDWVTISTQGLNLLKKTTIRMIKEFAEKTVQIESIRLHKNFEDETKANIKYYLVGKEGTVIQMDADYFEKATSSEIKKVRLRKLF